MVSTDCFKLWTVEHVFDYTGVMEPPARLTDSSATRTPRSAVEEASALVTMIGEEMVGCADADLVDLIAQLEELKNQCCAIQADAALTLERQRMEQASTARERDVARRSVVSELALARRESPHRARTLLGLAKVLDTELPRTARHLRAGHISEYRAILMAQETACLEKADRLRVDQMLAEELPGLSNREVAARARHVAYELDPRSIVQHIARAENERRVSIRPAPACMAIVSALLPVAQGVAVHASLLRAAQAARSAGEERGQGQIMADTLVTRITGQSSAPAVPIEVQLIVSDDTLLGEADTPALLTGCGPIPAGVARRLFAAPSTTTASAPVPGEATDAATRHWIRRLYVRPEDGQLLAMDSKRRLFPEGLRRYIIARDGNTCRTPWCDAPIAHIDHVTPVREGGPTAATNAQGLCIQCNLAKEAPGWHTRAAGDGAVTTRTPTGHSYTTHPPPLPHGGDPPGSTARVGEDRRHSRTVDHARTGRAPDADVCPEEPPDHQPLTRDAGRTTPATVVTGQRADPASAA